MTPVNRNQKVGESKVTRDLKYFSLPDVPQLFGRRGTEMDGTSHDKFSKRYSMHLAVRILQYTASLLLIHSAFFFFSSTLHAQEKEVEEPTVIREGPPPLVEPQY